MPLAEKLPALSEGDRILVVLARVLPNFSNKRNTIAYRNAAPLLQADYYSYYDFFYFLSCAGIYHPANRTLEYFTQCYYEQ